MKKKEKIDSIIKFVASFPESTASRTIMKRYFLDKNSFETGQELGLQLKDILSEENKDEIDFCFYLVK